MILQLLFQILISWLIGFSIILVFNKAVLARDNEIYREPALLTSLFAVFEKNLSIKAELIASILLHHIIGLCFSGIYSLIWYAEFGEISWTICFIIGLISGLLRIISWTFLLEIVPAASLTNFKGYYLQLVFVQNIFTITTIALYRLLLYYWNFLPQ